MIADLLAYLLRGIEVGSVLGAAGAVAFAAPQIVHGAIYDLVPVFWRAVGVVFTSMFAGLMGSAAGAVFGAAAGLAAFGLSAAL
jgi:hypothetical protein